ncbi:MAG: class I SAM-dependent methyltransferase [Minisyncoccia bacterium]
MENISIVNYIKTNLSGQLCNVLELGSGDQSEAMQIVTEISGEYFSIDKKETDKPVNSQITFINANFFGINEVDKIIHNKKFDLIFANYSLCFNKKDVIIEHLPYYFGKLTGNGIFYVGDFTLDEQVVKKRTNLDDEWFFDFIKANFSSFKISRQNVFEKEHGHSHSVFRLIAYK